MRLDAPDPATPGAEPETDVGAALILALAMMLIATLIVLPALRYTMTVTKTGRQVEQKVERAEAVKGGLRTVLADGKGLYQACKGAGLTQPVALASPGLNVGVTTTCTTTADTLAEDPANLWYAAASTWVGSTLPSGLSGGMYGGSGGSDPTLWLNDTSIASDGGMVWTPQ